MAGFIVLLSAAVTLAVPSFIIARDVRETGKASTPPALPLAQVAVSDPEAATNLKSTSSSIPKPLATLAVATLAYHSSKAAKTNSPNGTLGSVPQLQPPKVVVETNYVVYTQVKTVAPSYVTVTKTVQPPPPPPPPPPPSSPSPSPPSKPKQAGPHPPPALVQSQRPDAATVANPTPSIPLSPITASSSSPPPPSAPQVLVTPATTTLISSSSAAPPTPPAAAASATTPAPPDLAPIMSFPNPGSGGSPSLNPNPQAQIDPAGGQPRGPSMGPPDPINGAFPGGVPNKTVDLPITFMFMLLFMLGAYVHITIYRRNAKRSHKFLISDIIFDFCMVRTVTCIFRITWSLVTTRGVVLMALLTENGGASLLFAVNIFFAQRLVRSIHPKAGWCTAFSQLTFILLITVPAFVILNMTLTIVSFFSAGNVDRLEVTDDLLKFGISWNTWLAIFPIVVVSGCLSVPGPKPERFGSGSQRVKVALLYFGSVLLVTGQSIRQFALFNKEPPGTTSVVFSKAVFYTTGFAFELVVVGLYAIMRVDLRFHVPNGSSGHGDYSGDEKKGGYTAEDIERLIGGLEVPHQIMRERKGPEDMEMVFTVFFATKVDDNPKETEKMGETEVKAEDATLPERPKRITRRQTLIDAIKPPPRIPRESSGYPDITAMYQEVGGGEYAARQSGKPSMYSQFDNSKVYDAQYQQYWRSYGKEKGTMRSIDLKR